MAEKVWFGPRRNSFSIIWSPQGQEPCPDGECPVVVGCLGEISVGSLFYYIAHVKGNHMMLNLQQKQIIHFFLICLYLNANFSITVKAYRRELL